MPGRSRCAKPNVSRSPSRNGSSCCGSPESQAPRLRRSSALDLQQLLYAPEDGPNTQQRQRDWHQGSRTTKPHEAAAWKPRRRRCCPPSLAAALQWTKRRRRRNPHPKQCLAGAVVRSFSRLAVIRGRGANQSGPGPLAPHYGDAHARFLCLRSRLLSRRFRPSAAETGAGFAGCGRCAVWRCWRMQFLPSSRPRHRHRRP
mmetsp:Transcript_30611/g.77053  ORF Transcript_30611/g.77053 Transcript_30611/m.77053 type:complete len:201 (+) Transcript_30611:801-1403(+)